MLEIIYIFALSFLSLIILTGLICGIIICCIETTTRWTNMRYKMVRKKRMVNFIEYLGKTFKNEPLVPHNIAIYIKKNDDIFPNCPIYSLAAFQEIVITESGPMKIILRKDQMCTSMLWKRLYPKEIVFTYSQVDEICRKGKLS